MGAHPRSRGENAPIVSVLPFNQGSSPLTRGKQDGGQHGREAGRLIPAHAGKTLLTTPPRRLSAAHPRSRGENITRNCSQMVRVGSSPLTRGKRSLTVSRATLNGLIPAHAGKTTLTRTITTDTTAHPRSRGENGRAEGQQVAAGGSSPLTRGKHALVAASVNAWGLIPAHAGKTRRRRRCR